MRFHLIFISSCFKDPFCPFLLEVMLPSLGCDTVMISRAAKSQTSTQQHSGGVRVCVWQQSARTLLMNSCETPADRTFLPGAGLSQPQQQEEHLQTWLMWILMHESASQIRGWVFCGGSKTSIFWSQLLRLSVISHCLCEALEQSHSQRDTVVHFGLGFARADPAFRQRESSHSLQHKDSSQEFMDTTHISHRMIHSSKAYWKTVPVWQPYTRGLSG